MQSLWLSFFALWVALGLPGIADRMNRPHIADAALPQALSVVGTLLLAFGPKGPKPVPPAAFAFVVLAFIFAVAARLQLGASWSPAVQLPDKIEEGGAFGVLRHPIYTAVGAAAVATAAASRTPANIAGAGLVVIGLAWKAAAEEQALAPLRGENVVRLNDYR